MSSQQSLHCPPATDTTDLHFKLVKRLDIVSYGDKYLYANLLAVASSCGLTFIGACDGFFVVKTDSIGEETFLRKLVQVSCQVTHLAVNSDDSLLAVGGILPDKSPIANIYSITSMIHDGKVAEVQKVVVSSSCGVSLTDLVWNPVVPHLLSCCLTDGSLILVQRESSLQINSLPAAAGARCLCWSPKGKQIVVGSDDGKLTQYRPDLTAAKALPAPNIFDGNVTVVNVLWISNFQFAAYYRSRHNSNESPNLLIITAEKNQPITYVNYEDITFGTPGFRCPQFYFSQLSAWNVIVISSANSTEVAVLSMESGGNSWKQLIVGDSSRAEMPLNATNDETYPLGMAIDLSCQTQVPWGEAQLPPMPRLLLISSEGRLCLYNVVSLMSGVPPALCAAPTYAPPDSLFHSSSSQTSTKPPLHEKFSLPVASDPPVVSKLSTTPVESRESQVVAQVDLNSIPLDLHKRETNEPETEVGEEPQVAESVYVAAIVDEISTINQQIRDLTLSLKIDDFLLISSPEEFSGAVGRLDNLTEFKQNVEGTMKSQAEEVSELKLETLELRARVEDATLINKRRSSKLCTKLHSSENLDPVTSRTLKEILGLRTYIDSQIKLIGDHLDRQWENHQRSRRKDAKQFMKTPFLEDVLKTISIHKNLINYQRNELDRMQKEIENGSLKSRRPVLTNKGLSKDLTNSLNRSNEFSKLADSFLGLNIKGKDEVIQPDDFLALVRDKKMKEARSCELSTDELTLLLDLFEDAQVPQVSQVVSFSEQEAHRKQVAERIRKASENAKKKRQKDQTALSVTETMPKMTSINFEAAFSNSVAVTPKTVVKAEEPVTSINSKPSVNVSRPSFSLANTKELDSSNPAVSASITNTSSVLFPSCISDKSSSAFSTFSSSTTSSAFAAPSIGNTTARMPLFSSGASGIAFSQEIASNSKSGIKPVTVASTAKSEMNVTMAVTSIEHAKSSQSTSDFTFKLTGPSSIGMKPLSTVAKVDMVSPAPLKDEKSRTVTSPALTKTDAVVTSSQLTKSFTAELKLPVLNAPETLNFALSKLDDGSKDTKTGIFGNQQSPITRGNSTSATDSKASPVLDTFSFASVIPSSSPKHESTGDKTAVNIFGTVASKPTSAFFSLPTSSSPEDKLAVTAIATTSAVVGVNPTTAYFATSATNVLTNAPSSSYAVTSPASTFGSSQSLFSSTPTSSTATMFGTSSASTFSTPTTSSTASLFETTTAPTLFGAGTATTSTTTSLFGSSSVGAGPVANLFATTPTTNSTSNIFGSSFGQSTTTAPSNLFGSTSSQSPTKFANDINQTTSLFGQVLGSSSATASTPGNIFSQVTPNKSTFDSGSSIFGSVTSTSQFHSSSSNVFSQKSPGLFGSTPGAYGQTNSNSSTSIFGGSPFASSTTAPAPTFGQTASNAFSTSVFGSQPVANQSIFGQAAASFSGTSPVSNTSAGSIFGGSAAGTFASGSFSGGGFSNVSSSAPQSAFGSAPVFSKPSGSAFGSAPVFGGSPPSGPSFGGSATFGSTPVFGSSTKVFGSPSNTNTGSNFGQASGFEAAAQNSVGFGNLAQMTGQQTGFGSNFGSTSFGAQQPSQQQQQQQPSFGGTSFSSWR